MALWLPFLHSRVAQIFLVVALVYPCTCSSSSALTMSVLSAGEQASYIPSERVEVEQNLAGDDTIAAHFPLMRASIPDGESLHQSSQMATQRDVPASAIKNVKVIEAASPPVPKEAVVDDERAAAEAGEVMEDRRWSNHMRAYCTASFASGLTVGVVLTLLLLSLPISDRLPVSLPLSQSTKSRSSADRTPAPAPESPAVEGTARAEHATESVESIHRFGPRCGFLVGMLLVQSLSSFMLAGFQDLIQHHPSIVFFLTMVVGTGGNVGGQSVVLAVRRLAYGEEVSLSEQISVGVQLSAVLAPLALLRAYVQGTSKEICLVICAATFLIVVLAAALGTALPKLLNRIKVDPAHATPVIQVLMDMVGVLVTCVLGYAVLDLWLPKK